MADYFERALEVHQKVRGKIEIKSKLPVDTRDDLSVAYTPGVARPCEAIAAEPARAYDLGYMV